MEKNPGEIAALIQQNKHLQDTTALTVKNNEFVEKLEKCLDSLDKIEEMKRKIL